MFKSDDADDDSSKENETDEVNEDYEEPKNKKRKRKTLTKKNKKRNTGTNEDPTSHSLPKSKKQLRILVEKNLNREIMNKDEEVQHLQNRRSFISGNIGGTSVNTGKIQL